MTARRRALVTAAACALVAWPALRWFERANVYIPSRKPSGVLARSFGMPSDEASLRTADGVLVDATFLPSAPVRPKPLAPAVDGPLAKLKLAVLFCHGNAGNLTHRFFKAHLLHRLGLGVLLFDYRGYGRSGGSPSEAGTYADAEAAWRYLTRTRGIPPENIVIQGESLGCAVAVELARRHHPRALILESPFTSVAAMAAVVFPHLPLGWLVFDRYDNLAKIREIGAPLLVMHSPEDDIVPFSMGQELYAAALEPKRLFRMKGDHNEGYIDTGPAYAREISDFLSRPAPAGPRLDDASGLDSTEVAGVVTVRSEADVRGALERARRERLKVSIAGRRHSMGGQTLGRGHLVLDMMGLDKLSFDAKTGVLTAQAGATWRKIQRYLDARGRSVKVMQSDNIFSVGGSLSVDAHGWQPNSGPVASTVRGLRVMLASGETVDCSRDENPELFRAALGGYGLMGVILEARLETVPNVLYRKTSWYFPAERYPGMFRWRVASNPRAGLAYGRLSVDAAHFLTEAGLHVYEPASPQPRRLPPLSDEGWVELKRRVFRASERSEAGKRRRWLLEKGAGDLVDAALQTRNTVMNPDIHVLWPVDPARRDILQEYFVPERQFRPFLQGLRRIIPAHRQDLLNVTLRDVRRDPDSLLAYAKEDSFAFVLFFSQKATPEAEADMRALTRELVDLSLEQGGSFYLPYRLHYAAEQFRRAYPRAGEFFAAKRRYDPDGLFASKFYDHLLGRDDDEAR